MLVLLDLMLTSALRSRIGDPSLKEDLANLQYENQHPSSLTDQGEAVDVRYHHLALMLSLWQVMCQKLKRMILKMTTMMTMMIRVKEVPLSVEVTKVVDLSLTNCWRLLTHLFTLKLLRLRGKD